MSRVDVSPEQLDAMAAVPSGKLETHPCLHCGNPYLEGYPHRHSTEPQSGYDPMPPRPPDLMERVAVIRREYLAEMPVQLHVSYVPNRTEAIGISQYSAQAAGIAPSTIDALDTGELGSPPWSPPMHRRVGGIAVWGEAVTILDNDYQIFPWARNLQGLRRWCASKHRTWYEHRGEPLCWTLTRLVVLGGYSVGRSAQLQDISPERAESLLATAIDKWWAWTSNDQNGIEMRPRRPAA